MQQYDVAIVGGGIVGLATGYRLTQSHSDLSIAIFEKESQLAAHQTGHNSGVLHSGIYYRPGSLRAVNCRAGKLAMQEFCQREGVPFELCGKVIVAVFEEERAQLKAIYERGQANGIACEIISKGQLQELEPHVSGVEAIHVPESGIVDYKAVSEKLGERIKASGHEIRLNSPVIEIRQDGDGVVVVTPNGEVKSRYLVTCGGLWADRLIKISGESPIAPIVPFRGEYYELKPEVQHLCRNLIYPVPDPSFPFLGVHFTRMIHGGVECGPNAVLAFARAGYHKTDVNLKDLGGILSHSGFYRLALKNWKAGLGEMWRSWSKTAFVHALQRLIPEIQSGDLVSAPAGVRAQALGRDGKILDDFVIQKSGRTVHVGNAPSPAATASLNIGKLIVNQLVETGLK